MTNEDMDQAIIELLDGKTLKFCQINACLNPTWPKDDCRDKLYRQIDRRLQAMRKTGKVKFSHGFGWSLK